MHLRASLKTGLGFGLTSGIITTLGLLIGLSVSTNSKLAVIGGIITIAVADSFSDALGIHISEEAKHRKDKYVWEASIMTFFAKFFFAISFLVPVIFFSLNIAIIISVLYGLLLIAGFSVFISKNNGNNTLAVVSEHLFVAVIVIILSNLTGRFISAVFGGYL